MLAVRSVKSRICSFITLISNMVYLPLASFPRRRESRPLKAGFRPTRGRRCVYCSIVVEYPPMCQLLGMNSNNPSDIRFSFAGLMQRGGNTDTHADGWGIAFYEGKACRLFLEPIASAQSKMAEFIRAYPIKSQIIISHIRRATQGSVCLENTHPFSRELWGRQWTFAHNGHLKNFRSLALASDRYTPIGSTDSEYAFCWLLESILQAFAAPPDNITDLWQFIYQRCCDISQLGPFNILLSDSKYLYAFASTRLSSITRRAPFGQAHLKDCDMAIDFKQTNHENDVITVVATEPLTGDENWEKFADCELKILQHGIVVGSYLA